jgi:hypothetical protein
MRQIANLLRGKLSPPRVRIPPSPPLDDHPVGREPSPRLRGVFFSPRPARACLLLGLAAVLVQPGCVERKLFINSDPPEAVLFVDGKPQGKTPAEMPFYYYGKREVELRLEGCRSKRELVDVDPPWFQYFPFDFFFEVLWPWTLHDDHTCDIQLEPYLPSQLSEEGRIDLLERADALRYGAFTEGSPTGGEEGEKPR